MKGTCRSQIRRAPDNEGQLAFIIGRKDDGVGDDERVLAEQRVRDGAQRLGRHQPRQLRRWQHLQPLQGFHIMQPARGNDPGFQGSRFI